MSEGLGRVHVCCGEGCVVWGGCNASKYGQLGVKAGRNEKSERRSEGWGRVGHDA